MNLFVAMLLARFLLVEARQAAVMALVEPIVFLHRQPQPAHFLECEVKRLDRPRLDAGETGIRIDAAFFHQLSGGFCLFNALFGDIDIPPSGKAVFEIPLRLAVAKKDELRH